MRPITRRSGSLPATAAGPKPPFGKQSLRGSLDSISTLSLPYFLVPDWTRPLSSIIAPPVPLTSPAAAPATKFPWRTGIVTTTFWIGENAAPNNPVPNHASSWDSDWLKSYGGVDTPARERRVDYRPATFVPQQNPFYIALPYNDVTMKGHKPEAASVIPWFGEALQEPGRTVLKGRWLAIRFRDRVAYAQWEDCGPFRTDHAEYVFGTERPKPNLNKGAGLDVSPAVRDYLGMADTDVTDWRFVEFSEVPPGPWSKHGENNSFVLQRRADEAQLALQRTISATPN